MTAPVFVVERMPTGPEFVLEGPEGRHAVSVRRLQSGEHVVLTDGLGHWAEGEVRSAEGKDRLTVTLHAGCPGGAGAHAPDHRRPGAPQGRPG